MFNNIFKRWFTKLGNSALCMYIDRAETGNGRFSVKGWAFNKNAEYDRTRILLKTSSEEKSFDIELKERLDVYNAYNFDTALNCGFELSGTYESPENIHIYFEGTHGKDIDRFEIAAAPSSGSSKSLKANKSVAGYTDYSEFKASKLTPVVYPDELFSKIYDIIIPIYNGYEFFDKLFETIEKTELNYNLYLINDCSTDERVLPYLSEYAEKRDNVLLINNKENLGFVQSVNKALILSENDVALVNSDVILPDKWLERLMLPIVTDTHTASSTPFTTCGTICSFPNFCEDNPIFLGLDVDEIDAVFSQFTPSYMPMPTGVGFCMGMSRKAISRVGELDAKTFYKGYGEENDWCQRAIKLGYKNVQVENLFVYHKHGGSFLSEDKKRYIERNAKLLNKMYPNYDKDVASYIASDPCKTYREYAKFKLLSSLAKGCKLIFDHSWGGGANSYSKARIKSENDNGYAVIKIIQDGEGIYIEYIYHGFTAGFSLENITDIEHVIDDVGGISEIIVNELISFTDIYPTLRYIQALKEKFAAKLIMLGHDFFGVCPSIYLINKNGKHCFKADNETCKKCIDENSYIYNKKYETIEKWRNEWGAFLRSCDEITVFSNNSKEYFNHHYGTLDNIAVVPHKVDYMQKLLPYPVNENKTVIGVPGNFMDIKGAPVILEMHRLIKSQNLPLEIVIIGQNLYTDEPFPKDLKITGRYKIEDIPKIYADNKINLVFIASVCPETFSYTTEEAIKMGMHVVSFDIGAPAERIKQYEKGLIIPEMTAQAAINTILEFAKQNG